MRHSEALQLAHFMSDTGGDYPLGVRIWHGPTLPPFVRRVVLPQMSSGAAVVKPDKAAWAMAVAVGRAIDQGRPSGALERALRQLTEYQAEREAQGDAHVSAQAERYRP